MPSFIPKLSLNFSKSSFCSSFKELGNLIEICTICRPKEFEWISFTPSFSSTNLCPSFAPIGKVKIDLSNVDLASFSSHKFYGMKGIGVLVKKEGIELEPLIHGGKSTTNYRSGTPALPLIISFTL